MFLSIYDPLLIETFVAWRRRKDMLPNSMQTIRPWSDFKSGIVSIASADGSYMDSAKGGTLPYA